jgi:chemotaxis protein MotB
VLDLEGRPLNVTNQGMNLSLVRQDENQLVESPPEIENPEFVELARLRQIETLENLRGQVEAEINLNQQFEWFKDSVTFEITEEGLMVQIIP